MFQRLSGRQSKARQSFVDCTGQGKRRITHKSRQAKPKHAHKAETSVWAAGVACGYSRYSAPAELSFRAPQQICLPFVLFVDEPARIQNIVAQPQPASSGSESVRHSRKLLTFLNFHISQLVITHNYDTYRAGSFERTRQRLVDDM